MNARDSNVGEPGDAIAERSRGNSGLLGDREIRRAGGDDEDGAAAGRGDWLYGSEIGRAGERVELDGGNGVGERGGRFRGKTGYEEALAPLSDARRDRHEMLGSLPFTEDDFREPLPQRTVMVDGREA